MVWGRVVMACLLAAGVGAGRGGENWRRRLALVVGGRPNGGLLLEPDANPAGVAAGSRGAWPALGVLSAAAMAVLTMDYAMGAVRACSARSACGRWPIN